LSPSFSHPPSIDTSNDSIPLGFGDFAAWAAPGGTSGPGIGGNAATLYQIGRLNNSAIDQSGTGNEALVGVLGFANSTSHEQIGDNNRASAGILGIGNTIDVTQNGNDKSTVLLLATKNINVVHDQSGSTPSTLFTKVTGKLSAPIYVSNPSWGSITVESQ
jgi:hypothetical protein